MSESILQQIERCMPVGEFRTIMVRLQELHREEEAKLKALADLQQYYVGAQTDGEREAVHKAVAGIRELSRTARAEIRQLNARITPHMSLEEAARLYAALTDSHPA